MKSALDVPPAQGSSLEPTKKPTKNQPKTNQNTNQKPTKMVGSSLAGLAKAGRASWPYAKDPMDPYAIYWKSYGIQTIPFQTYRKTNRNPDGVTNQKPTENQPN